MNLVQILHSREMQILHPLEGHILHLGRAESKIFRLANMQKLPSGLKESFALRPTCIKFILAKMQNLHVGVLIIYGCIMFGLPSKIVT